MSKKVSRYVDETITFTPSMVTCKYMLTNGQMLIVRFTRHRNSGKKQRSFDAKIKNVFTVTVLVADNKRHLRKMLRAKDRRVFEMQTGRAGLEALSVASRYVKSFADNYVGYGQEMHVIWSDDKRRKAYRRLLRHAGFVTFYNEDNEPSCYGYRNPKFYTFVPDEEPQETEIKETEGGQQNERAKRK